MTLPALEKIVSLPSLKSFLNVLLQNAPDGVLSAPGVAFANDQSSGLCRNEDGSISIVSQGKSSLQINADGSLSALVPSLGLNVTLAGKMKQLVMVTDFGVVHDPNGENVTANSIAYLNAITMTSGQARLHHPQNITAVLNPMIFKVPIHLELAGTIMLARDTNASIIELQSSNIVIDGLGTGILDGNRTGQVGGVGTALAGITANCTTTSAAMPLPPADPIAISSIRIRNLKIKSVFNWPISLGFISDCRVEGCTFHDSMSSPQFIFSVDNCWFNHNHVYDITDGGFVFYQGNRHCGATGNIIHDCHDGIGVYCDNDQMSADMFVTIQGNIVYNNRDSGIGLTTGGSNPVLLQQRVIVAGNILANNNTGGRSGGGSIGIVGAQGVLIDGNMIFGDGSNGTGTDPSYSIFVDGVSSFVTIQNNIIGDCGSASALGVGIWLASPNNCSVINNGFYCTQGASGVMKAGIGGGFGAAGIYRDNYTMGAINGYLDQVNKPVDLLMQQRQSNGSLAISNGIEVTSGDLIVDQGRIAFSNFYAATAQGANQSGAQAFNQQMVIVTVGASGAGVIPDIDIPNGAPVLIFNRTGNSIKIYPNTNGQIEGLGENNPLSLANTQCLMMFKQPSTTYTGGQWWTTLMPAGTGS
ncbi:right-handed parallel beta-helix repeat-containing protein [Gluconobacter sp. Dm-44]|uniref:right-handed parallel beta-helix repeat-containing protein n=1 Tax=Gluconobacter sp. Dm-44 TaxID=2799805 RepID=UPI001B8B8A9C|nr:right-handed parallel beta-helix repeat-containing protein [Gluconobacter sp. Dm-44]MBS1060762.1 right-handed parallel beta-helix repeat-containing protein [Gluconobacter sp. Dm-44]